MANPVSTPPSGGDGGEVITPLQKMLAGTLVLSLILVPLASFVFYLAPFYKAEGSLYRGTWWLIGGAVGVLFSALFSYVWMTRLPAMIEARQRKREQRAKRAAEERRLAKRADLEKSRSDRAAKTAAAATAATLASEEE